MLKRILGGLAIASVLVGVVVLVFWWRSYRHSDHYSLGTANSTRTIFTTLPGKIAVKTEESVGGMITSRSEIHPFSQVLLGCMIIPGFWLAIWVRSKLPRPGRDTPGRLLNGKNLDR